LHDALFQPLQLGAFTAKNRIMMAPLTRGRSDPGSVPNAMMAEYYRQRAGAGRTLKKTSHPAIDQAALRAATSAKPDSSSACAGLMLRML